MELLFVFRTKAVEYMLASGHSRTWMIGNTIVTITTSGTYIDLDGVCESCLVLRQRTANLVHGEKVKVEKGPKQRKKALVGSKEESPSQAMIDHIHGAGPSPDTQAPSSAQMSAESSSLEKTALHKVHSVDSAKLMSEAHSSVASERRFSEPLVPVNPQNCQCVCQGWAEIFIRRPSGNISWIMRLQNRESSMHLDSDISTAVVDDPQIGECKLTFYGWLKESFYYWLTERTGDKWIFFSFIYLP